MLHASLKCSETASLSYWKTIFLSIFLKIWSLSSVYSLWTSVQNSIRNPSKFYQNLRTVSWKTSITFSMTQYFCLPSEALHWLSAAIQMTDVQHSAGLPALQWHDSIFNVVVQARRTASRLPQCSSERPAVVSSRNVRVTSASHPVHHGTFTAKLVWTVYGKLGN